MKNGIGSALAAVALIAALWAGLAVRDAFRDRARTATEALEGRSVALQALGRVSDSLKALRGALETAHARGREEGARLTLRTMSEATRQREIASRQDSSLRAILPEEGRPALDSLETSFTIQLAGRDSIIERSRSETRDALADGAACNRAADDLRKIARGWEQQTAEWKRQAQPGFFKKLLGWVPAFVAGGATVATVVTVAKA